MKKKCDSFHISIVYNIATVWTSYYMLQFNVMYRTANIVSKRNQQAWFCIRARLQVLLFPQSSKSFIRYSLKWLCVISHSRTISWSNIWHPSVLLGVVSLTFREIYKIISRKYTMPEIIYIVKISSWNFVRVPKSMALGTRTKFELKIFIRSTISAIHTFWKNILESLRNVSETTPCGLVFTPALSCTAVCV